MFAVIAISGKQYKVSLGDMVVVDHLAGKVGDTLDIPSLMVADGEKVTLGKDAATTVVKAELVSHGQGEKMHVRRFIAKSRHRRHIGFRAQTTTLKIEAIGAHKVQKETAAKVEKKTK